MAKFSGFIGQRFGRLVILRLVYGMKNGTRCICQCDCGVEHVALLTHVRAGRTQSCGCHRRDASRKRRYRHGHSTPGNRNGSSVYMRWKAMKQRCLNPRSRHHDNYGGRGVTVCERWLMFENFLADMGEPPSPELTLERVDNDRGYELSNCIWATRKAQSANKRPWTRNRQALEWAR